MEKHNFLLKNNSSPFCFMVSIFIDFQKAFDAVASWQRTLLAGSYSGVAKVSQVSSLVCETITYSTIYHYSFTTSTT